MNIKQDISSPESATEDRALAIRDALRNAIVDRRLTPGTKLTESEVGALFDVSRTVARAGLQMLSFEGLVRLERNRGAFVSNPTPEEARQVFASRRLIEPGVVMSALERLDADKIAILRHQLEEESRYLNERGPTARRAEIKASGDFHLLLASMAGNAILERFMEELIARSSLVIALYGRSGISSCGHNEHMAARPDAAPHRPYRGRSGSAGPRRHAAEGRPRPRLGQQRLRQRVARISQSIENVEVMPVRLFDRLRLGAEAFPQVGEQGVLAQKFRSFGGADPAGESCASHWLQQRRAFPPGFLPVDLELGVHGRLHEGPQIVDARE